MNDSTTPNPHQLNVDLVRALGIKDWADVFRVTLTIQAGEEPRLNVERRILTADGLQTAHEVLKLRADQAGPGKPDAAAAVIA